MRNLLLGILLSIICITPAWSKVEFCKPDDSLRNIQNEVITEKIKSADITVLGIYFCHKNCDHFAPYFKKITLNSEKPANFSGELSGEIERHNPKSRIYEKDNFALSFNFDFLLKKPVEEKKYQKKFISGNYTNSKTTFKSRYLTYNYQMPTVPYSELFDYAQKEFGPYNSDENSWYDGFNAICGNIKEHERIPALLKPYCQNLIVFKSTDFENRNQSFYLRGNSVIDGKIDEDRADVSGFIYYIYAALDSITFADGSTKKFNEIIINEKEWLALKEKSELTLKGSVPWEGKGTEQSPFIIKSASDLLALSDNENYINGNYYFKQTEDITDLNSTVGVESWGAYKDNVMLCHYDNLIFSGHYDGNGKKISGLKIKNTEIKAKTIPEATNKDLTGLFRVCRNAEIKNLTIECDLDVKDSSYVGAIAGISENTIFSNITIKGNITGNENIGALSGVCYDSKLTDISSTAAINGNKNVGGIIGSASKTLLNNITVENTSITGEEHVGGIAGALSDKSVINNSKISADITAKSDNTLSPKQRSKKESYCGGAAGLINGFCSASKVKISGKITANKCAGGFAGLLTGNKKTDSEPDNYASISNFAEITALEGISGGIFGEATNNISISNCVNSGTIKGKTAGGISGLLAGFYSSPEKKYISAIINSCTNHGIVGTTNEIKCFNAGGIVGHLKDSGYVLNSYSDGNISSIEKCGGITSECNGFIKNCYAIGPLKTESSSTKVGGIAAYVFSYRPIGDVEIRVENCFTTNDTKYTDKKYENYSNENKTIADETKPKELIGKNMYFSSVDNIQLDSSWDQNIWQITKGKYPEFKNISEKINVTVSNNHIQQPLTNITNIENKKEENNAKTITEKENNSVINQVQETILSEKEAPVIIPQMLELEPE